MNTRAEGVDSWPRGRRHASLAVFIAGVATWQFTSYPLYVGDVSGVTAWNLGPWSVPVLPLALVLTGIAIAPASRRARVSALFGVVAYAALLWLWPWGAGFYSPDAWGDRLVGSLAYPVLTAAWLSLREWGSRSYLGLAPLVLVVALGTAMWPGPDGPIPWATAWRSNTWPLGPAYLHVSGAGLAAAIAAWSAFTLAERFRPPAPPPQG